MSIDHAAERLRVTALRASDAAEVRRWMADFLRAHNRHWAEMHGLGWSATEVDAQMLAFDVVEERWQQLWRASKRFESNLVAVARLDGRAMGAVWADHRHNPYLKVPVGVLSWIYVAPWARGHRVGSKLIDVAKAWMRARDLRSCEVSVLAGNEAAIRLYERAGLQLADVRMMGSLEEE